MSCVFAKIDENNVVLAVVHMDESVCPTEAEGQAHLEANNNWPANLWIKGDVHTHRNQSTNGGTPFRGNMPAIGYEWDAANQVFWPPKGNHPTSWVKNNETCDWESPVGLLPAIDDAEKLTHFWFWNEGSLQWEKKQYITPISQAAYDAAEDKDDILGRKR